MVRIVKGDFATNYKTYEEVIKGCFYHLFWKRYYNREEGSANESFNHMFTEMERLEVFDKWDITKIDAEKQDKKIEQFLFKNIESILYKEYHDRRKRTLRFKRLASVDNIHRDTYSTERKEIFTDDLCPDLTDLDMVTDTQKKDAQALKDKAHSTFKRYPTTNDIPAMCSEKYQSPSEALEEKDILNMILNSCKNETEAKIVALKLKGMEHTEIAASCNCTYPQVSQYLSKIKGRYISNAAKANKLQKA